MKNNQKAEARDLAIDSIKQNEDGTLLYELMEDYNAEKYKNEEFIN